MFNVGDRIRIVRVADRWRGSNALADFEKMIGHSYVVRECYFNSVRINRDGANLWDFDEIELDKNYYVTEILKDL